MATAKEKETTRTPEVVSKGKPLGPVTYLEHEMERMFRDFFGRPFPGMGLPRWFHAAEGFGIEKPAIEVYEEKDDVVVKAELPGLKREDLELNISDNLLTLKGDKKKEEEVKEKGYYYSERSYGSFTRTVEIPKEVQAEKAKAVFKDGVLEIRLPKTEEAKRKETRIKVE
jgi:HSP20 family protein